MNWRIGSEVWTGFNRSGPGRAVYPAMSAPISNAEIAGKLLALAHLLVTRKENPFKIKAYRRAAKNVQAMGESLSQLVDAGADLTQFAGIGPAIGNVIREIVETGT